MLWLDALQQAVAKAAGASGGRQLCRGQRSMAIDHTVSHLRLPDVTIQSMQLFLQLLQLLGLVLSAQTEGMFKGTQQCRCNGGRCSCNILA